MSSSFPYVAVVPSKNFLLTLFCWLSGDKIRSLDHLYLLACNLQELTLPPLWLVLWPFSQRHGSLYSYMAQRQLGAQAKTGMPKNNLVHRSGRKSLEKTGGVQQKCFTSRRGNGLNAHPSNAPRCPANGARSYVCLPNLPLSVTVC